MPLTAAVSVPPCDIWPAYPFIACCRILPCHTFQPSSVRTMSHPVRLCLALVLTASLASTSYAQLSGKTSGSGQSCSVDPSSLGSSTGCPDGEACCATTNVCVKRASCAEFAQFCPPPSCGKDTNFRYRILSDPSATDQMYGLCRYPSMDS